MPKRLRPEQLSDFGRQFEAWRSEHGLSQRVVADLMGVSQRVLSNWIRVDGMPSSVHQFARLAAIMDRTVEGLVGQDASVAPLRDDGYVERVLLRTAEPKVVRRYFESLRQNAETQGKPESGA